DKETAQQPGTCHFVTAELAPELDSALERVDCLVPPRPYFAKLLLQRHLFLRGRAGDGLGQLPGGLTRGPSSRPQPRGATQPHDRGASDLFVLLGVPPKSHTATQPSGFQVVQ